MRRTSLARFPAWSSAAVLLFSLGCAARTPHGAPIAATRTGAIGIAVGRYAPPVVYHAPPAGRSAGA